MQLDKIATQDIDELVEMAREAHAESKYSHYPFCQDTVRETFARHLQSGFMAVKCGKGDHIDGFFLACITGLVFTAQRIGRETSFWVRPEARGTRCAMLLVWAFLDWCDLQGLPAMTTIHFGKDNERTYRFIERMGMNEIGRLFGKDI
jgi:GNAT superfamily N-acetyltransferase